MTADEIKARTTMFDVLARYGMEANSKGFCRCCFHPGDREPSMKANDRFFHCFGCGAGGDVFKFVMLKEGCDFKTAFQILGGTYEHGSTPADRIRTSRMIMNRKSAAQEYHDKVDALKKELKETSIAITAYRRLLNTVEPMSDLWARWMNDLEWQLYIHEDLSDRIWTIEKEWKRGVTHIDVHIKN